MTPDSHSMDEFFIKPVTDTRDRLRDRIPEDVLNIANIPSAPDEETCCFAQLMNPDGLEADYAVTHTWWHPFERTVRSLSNFAEGVYKEIGKKTADDVVFWMCLFNVDPHRRAEEV